MTPVQTIIDLMLAQAGDRYVFGAETSPADPDPNTWDCSELVQWACARAGVRPTMPDGSWLQARHCKQNQTLIGVAEAVGVAGALLFRFDRDPFRGGRPPHSHVAMSLGDGRTIEARSTRLGVGIFDQADSRAWTHAARIPGVDYTPAAAPTESDRVTDGVTDGGPNALPVLRRGSTGAAVGRAQALLVAAGADADGLVKRIGGHLTPYPDRVYGPKTHAAVAWHQRINGLPQSGVVDAATWRLLLGLGVS